MPGPGRFLTAQWRHLAMLNYAVDPAILTPHLPAGVELDAWHGTTYLSVVGFMFLGTRVLGLPIPFHRNFPEVNLRFYVRRPGRPGEPHVDADGHKRGVVFLKELVPRAAIAWVARVVYGEAYLALPMRHRVALETAAAGRVHGSVAYEWRLPRTDGAWHGLRLAVDGVPAPLVPGSEAEFITEHYWGYCRQRDGGTMEYQVQHPPWRVWPEAKLSLAGDLRAIYGANFGDCLKQTPVSGLVAEGSPIVVHRGTRLPAY